MTDTTDQTTTEGAAPDSPVDRIAAAAAAMEAAEKAEQDKAAPPPAEPAAAPESPQHAPAAEAEPEPAPAAESAPAAEQEAEPAEEGWRYAQLRRKERALEVVDMFQHWVYENPKDGSDPDKCDAKWGKLWDRFMKGIDFSGHEDSKNTYGQVQGHIHASPFYYVEYSLAQLGAVQVYGNALKDQKKAVADYRHALSLGSPVSLPELFKTAGAKFAFDAPTLKNAVDLLENEIEQLQTKL